MSPIHSNSKKLNTLEAFRKGCKESPRWKLQTLEEEIEEDTKHKVICWFHELVGLVASNIYITKSNLPIKDYPNQNTYDTKIHMEMQGTPIY